MEKERTRNFINRVGYQIFAAGQSPDKSIPDLYKTIIDGSQLKSKRTQAGIKLAVKPFDWMGLKPLKRYTKRHLNSENTPFDRECEYIGNGWSSFVFKLDNVDPQVIKMDKESIGLSLSDKIKRVKYLESGHEQIKEWFRDIDGFVLPCAFFIGHLPYKNHVAVAIVQPYLEDVRDIFDDFTEEQITKLLSENYSLRSNLIKVADSISSVIANTNQTIDLIGDKNLSISPSKGLVLLDSCDTIYLPDLEGDSKTYKKKRQRMRFEKLLTMREIASKI